MAEHLVEQHQDGQKKVFGDAFSLENGQADQKTLNAFYRQRAEAFNAGETVWLPRTLDAESGVCADLYKGGEHVALLQHEYGYGTSVYVTNDPNSFGNVTLCDKVTFDEAVEKAEQYARQ